MYIRGLIPRDFAELAEAVPIVEVCVLIKLLGQIQYMLADLNPMYSCGITSYKSGIFSF